MNKKILVGLACLSLAFVTGCEKKCEEGYTKDGNTCTKETLMEDALVTEYVCEEGWNLENQECYSGEMPPIGDGCEEGTTDKIGSDGFCHHYKDATIKYSCSNGATLKDNKCYIVETKKLK